MAETKTTKPAALPLNASPKDQFLTTPWASKHKDMVDSDVFVISCNTAQLQYQGLLAQQVVDSASAHAVGYKLQGVIEFLGVLKNLSSTTPPAEKRRDPDNLTHK